MPSKSSSARRTASDHKPAQTLDDVVGEAPVEAIGPEPDEAPGAAAQGDPVAEPTLDEAAVVAVLGDVELDDADLVDEAPARKVDADEDEDAGEPEQPRRNGAGASSQRMGGRMPGHSLPGGRPVPAPRIPSKAENFVEGDHVVYPTHGVGKVERIATEEIAGHKLELIHITFEENRMTLRVPVMKARSAGLRKLATRKMFDEALAILKGRARIKRTMWSRRAQEYEAKINSGDPLSIAEVVRDLHRNAGQPDQSFSERQIYEAAMDRLAAELAALDHTEKTAAATKLTDYLKTIT